MVIRDQTIRITLPQWNSDEEVADNSLGQNAMTSLGSEDLHRYKRVSV